MCDHCDMWFHYEKCSDVTAENILENESWCSACAGMGHDDGVMCNDPNNTILERETMETLINEIANPN